MADFTYAVCKAIMHTFIELNKSVTTLQVKNTLRNLGYNATQERVSKTMDAIAGGTNSPYTYIGGGNFRIYTMAGVATTKTVSVPVLQTQTTTKTKTTTVKGKGSPKAIKTVVKKTKKTKNGVETLFVVFTKSGKKELNFKSHYALTRDDARRKYAKLEKVQYYKVGARLHNSPAMVNR